MAKMGRLRNGGTAAHWTAMFKSPRCTAKAKSTRQRCCNAAVKGWPVCRLHGARGGPKTPEGRERIRQANLKHGRYTEEGRRAAAEQRKLLRALGIKARPRGKLPEQCPRTGKFLPSTESGKATMPRWRSDAITVVYAPAGAEPE